eukprot:6193552-Pleurochrysis_carterae.AAC.1
MVHRRSGRPRTPLGVPISSVSAGREHRFRAHEASSRHGAGAAASVLPLRGGSGGSISQMLDAGGQGVAETIPAVLAVAAIALIAKLRHAASARSAPGASQAKKLAERT